MTGDTVIMDVGTSGQGNLTLISEQDSANFTSKNSSFNLGASLSPDNNIGGTISLGSGKVNSNYNSVIEQTGALAGDGGFSINVHGETHLKAALLDSSIAAQLAGNNSLTTQTLTVESIENTAKYTASQSSVGYNYNGTPQTGSDDKAGGTAGSQLTKGLSGGTVATSGEAHGTTYSAIAPADITITDNAAQTARTGQDAAQTVAMLNRDTQHANGSISNPFNQQKVAEQLEFLQLANELIITPVAAQAAKWIGDAFPPDPQHPERIDPAKLLAHAGLGAAMSQLLGTGWETGASAGALGDILPQVLAQAFEKDDKGQIKDPEAFKAANAIISAALASATGGDLAQTINSAMITQNAVGNNWLKHQEVIDLAKYKQGCAAGSQEACNNAIKLELLDKLRNRDLLNACVNLSAEACATQLNLDPAAKAYLVENFYTIGFGRVISQFGEHANQAAAPQQLTDIAISLIPVVGDVTGFVEAESPFDYTLAIIGALGPAGDAAKALVKEAKILSEAGDAVKAAEKWDAAQLVVANAARGKVFEVGVLTALNLPKNTTRIPVTLSNGKNVTVIPDALKNATIIEAKDVKYLSNSDQFRGYLATDKKIQLIVSPDTKISAPLQKLILKDSQGSIQVFDPVTKALTDWKPK